MRMSPLLAAVLGAAVVGVAWRVLGAGDPTPAGSAATDGMTPVVLEHGDQRVSTVPEPGRRVADYVFSSSGSDGRPRTADDRRVWVHQRALIHDPAYAVWSGRILRDALDATYPRGVPG